ncbi:condensation domain-containing protein [Streptomyces sp. NPDC050759]|uniref:condensation domain-containing protein n=1 Tax=Streptomyces sp. NPDC050759 TaxID=3365635 RepID=UPI0037905E21
MTTDAGSAETERPTGHPLLWAQQYHWAHYRLTPPGTRWQDNVRSAVPVPEGVGTDDLLRVVRDLVATHEALRTTYGLGPDGNVTARPGPAFDPPVDIREIDTTQTAERWALHFFDELFERDFDIEAGPQVRFGVAVQDGAPRWLLFMFHHIAIDTFGVMAFQRDLAAALRQQTEPGERRPQVPPPSAERDYEASPAGQRVNDRAQEYIAGVAAKFPASTIPVRAGSGRGPRFTQGALDSDAGVVVRDLARRFRAPESAVMMGVFAAALCYVTGNRRTALRASSANRFRTEQLDFVGCAAQTLPLLLTPPLDASLAQLVGYAKRSLTPVYRHGRHDHWQAREELLRAQFFRGVGTEAMVAFNYVDRSAERQNFSRIEEQEAYITGPKGRVVLSPVKADFFDHFGLFVRRSVDRLTLSVRYDAELLDDAWVERFLIGLHDVLVAAARPSGSVRDLLDQAGLPVLPADGRWAVRQGCRVSLDETERLLLSRDGVAACHVVAEEGTEELVAYVAAEGADPHTLRCHMAARLRSWPAAVIPDRMVIVPADASPADAAAGGEARGVPVLADARGDKGPGLPAGTPAATVLAEALSACVPDADWSAAWSYVGAGGRLGRADAFLDALRSRGVSGLDYADLYAAVPPAELAAKLKPATPRR